MATAELARQEWAEGHRRLEFEREEPGRYTALVAQVEAIMVELRRRVGSVYTLAELADVYSGSDPWVAHVLAELPLGLRYPAGVSVATDAAFHLYARGARDYVP
jgi:hypothetical protein